MKILVSIIMISLFLSACSSTQEKNEIKKKAEASTVKDSGALKEAIHHAIHSSEHLTDEQKTELEMIIEKNKKRAEDLSVKSYKLRSVLIQELLASNVNKKRVKLLKKDIKKVEKNKLDNTLETIELISEVVSNNPDKQSFSEPLNYFDRPSR